MHAVCFAACNRRILPILGLAVLLHLAGFPSPPARVGERGAEAFTEFQSFHTLQEFR